MTIDDPRGAGPLRRGAERRIPDDCTQTVAPFPTGQGAHHLIAAQAARSPSAVAVVDDRTSLTYAELDARADRLAQHLRSVGVGPEVVVAIFMQRSVDLVVSLLAVWKAGGAYLPLDPRYPADRLAFMLGDASSPVVVTEQGLGGRLPPGGHRLVVIDRDRGAIDSRPARPPSVDFDAEQLAYLIYTSGSTGTPKGVEVPQRALVNFLASMAREPGLTAGDVLVAVTTLSFDIAALELYLPLTTGGTVVVASAEVAASPRPLADLLQRSAATVVQATPATWRMLLDAGWPGRPGLKVLCGGEQLPVALASALLDRGVELWNMYGPTETTIWSTVGRVSTPGDAHSIGRPIADTTVYVLDPHLSPVPAGEVGELHIGGAGVARGYRGRPELTDERFIPDPFAAETGARLYKTGDLGRWRPDGTLECLGRLDHQVKIRGFRIELGEIEAALDAHPGVRASVVAATTDDRGVASLTAYVVAEGAAPTGAELRHRLLRTLPAHMVPSTFQVLDRLPLTPNGKVDRKALPTPAPTRATMGPLVPPRTPMEETLVAIWSEVLGVSDVGVDDDFFELGGHSLVALRVLSRVNEELGVDLGISALFDAPTVADMATIVTAATGRARRPRLVALDRATFIR
ncbi:MAG TPA: amino acid adenylation domain-containing protein [Acidimicrobiales bacterium]|jgi:amino acid adenylation domain-containing protein|nr:amino acid adenylation domain-containing protein [Acidimicrobiales bacterium]